MTNAAEPSGGAVAMTLGQAGAQVLVHHFRAAEVAEGLVASIRAAGGNAKAVAVDLTRAEGPHELAHRTRAIVGDRLDILVINASAHPDADPAQVTPLVFDQDYAANVRAPLFLIQQLRPALNQGSCIIFSFPAGTGRKADPASAALRGGLDGLIAGLASSLRPRGVRVDAIAGSPRATGRATEIARAVTAAITAAGRTGGECP